MNDITNCQRNSRSLSYMMNEIREIVRPSNSLCLHMGVEKIENRNHLGKNISVPSKKILKSSENSPPQAEKTKICRRSLSLQESCTPKRILGSVENKQTNKEPTMYELRLKRFNELRETERFLCRHLGINPKYENFVIISSSQMEEFRIYIQDLDSLKRKRQMFYEEVIAEIKYLLSELQIFQWSDFEKSTFSEDEFVLNTHNLKTLYEWKVRLTYSFELEQKKVKELKQKIFVYWNKFSVAQDLQDEFLTKLSNNVCLKKISEELKKELNYYEKLWEKKIRYHIISIRKEISVLWTKCNMNKDHNSSDIFQSENYNEELLLKLQNEKDRLINLQQENDELLNTANKWKELQFRLQELENENKNTRRLNNRGGILLKEEKARKKLQKSISTTQSKIMHLATKYKNETGCSFYYEGESVLQMIDKLRESRRNPKYEKGNQNRKSIKSKLIPLKPQNINKDLSKPTEKLKNFKNENNRISKVFAMKI